MYVYSSSLSCYYGLASPPIYYWIYRYFFSHEKKKKNNNSILFSRWLTEWKHIWNRISIDKIKFNKKKKTSEGLWDNIERETCRLQLLLMSIILFKHLSINRDDRGVVILGGMCTGKPGTNGLRYFIYLNSTPPNQANLISIIHILKLTYFFRKILNKHAELIL